MRQKSPLFIIMLGIISLVFVFVAFGWLKQVSLKKNSSKPLRVESADPLVINDPNYAGKKITEPLITSLSPQVGNVRAPIVIVEYSDLSCPYCRDMHARLEKIYENFSPSIRWVWKDLPVTHSEERSREAHTAARCAWRQRGFWPYAKALFENPYASGRDYYVSLAKTQNLNLVSFTSCLDSASVFPFIDYDIREAEALGISATPYLFIMKNGKIENRYSGLVAEEELSAFISSLLEKQ